MNDTVAEQPTVGSSQNPFEVSDAESDVEEITASTEPQKTLSESIPLIKTDDSQGAPVMNNELGRAVETPLKTPIKPLQNSNTISASPSTEKKMTPKMLEKLKEREEREKKKLEEKLARDKAKEEERCLKEEKRLQREAEKKARDEEKERIRKENEMKKEQLKQEREEKERKKLEEKEEKERKRLDEKRKKEEEKRQQEEEKMKKLEEQKKKEEDAKKKKEKLKISNFFKPKTTVKSTTVTETTSNEEKSDYKSMFQDFFVRDGVQMYETNRLRGDSLTKSIAGFDEGLNGSSDVKQWLTEQSLDKAVETSQNAQYIFENQLNGAPITVKFIRFYENVKGWIGTYTKSIPDGLGKNPYMELPEFIDFDDEAGEDEEGEGEDIDDDDDTSEADEEDIEDLQDFLEDDNNADTRRGVLGPLVPVVTWKGKSTADTLLTDPVIRIEILKAEVSFPIDPHADYWTSPQDPADQEKKGVSTADEPKQKKGKTIITVKEDLELFASKVQDCDFTVPTMVEILKKELPKYTKATIENTLRTLAKRMGTKPTEKKWEVNRELLNQSVEAAE